MTYSTPDGFRSGRQLRVEVLQSLAGVLGLKSEFAHLQAVTANTLPFALYEWHSTWCRHFLDRDPRIVDQPFFHVMRTGDGACVGIVPLILTQRRLGSLNVASVGLLGADPAITEIRSSLVAPGYEAEVAAALHRSLERSQDWDWIQWNGLRDEFNAALAGLRRIEWQPVAPHYLLDLQATWQEFHARLKRNIRESLRHGYNSLKRDGHRFALRIATEPLHVQAALERLFELHALRAGMTGTVVHADHFASDAVRRFMHDVCGLLAARGAVRVFELEIGGRIVASRIGFLVADSLYLYYSGFDPAWARYGVMTTTVAEAIKHAIAQGVATVNLSPGTDTSKTRWGPRAVAHQAAYETSNRLRSRLVRYAYLKARSGEGVQSWLLQRLVPGRSWK